MICIHDVPSAIPEKGILDKTVFYNLSHPGNDLPGRKGLQDGQVHRPVWADKKHHHIFVLHKVHAGLPADAAVYLGKQRGVVGTWIKSMPRR